jgi:hypothetical protein
MTGKRGRGLTEFGGFLTPMMVSVTRGGAVPAVPTGSLKTEIYPHPKQYERRFIKPIVPEDDDEVLAMYHISHII